MEVNLPDMADPESGFRPPSGGGQIQLGEFVTVKKGQLFACDVTVGRASLFSLGVGWGWGVWT